MKQKSSSTKFATKHFATAALMLSVGAAAVCAQPGQANMTLRALLPPARSVYVRTHLPLNICSPVTVRSVNSTFVL